MKRFIFSVIALMAAATACTESGLIDSPQHYGSQILFDTYIGKTPVTKAESIDLAYLEDVDNGGAHIYAFMSDKENANPNNIDFSSAYMDGRIVCTEETTETNQKVWEYQVVTLQNIWTTEDVYWPGDVNLAFVAYKAEDYTPVANGDDFYFDFIIKDNISEQVDLLVSPLQFVSETVGKDTYVNLQFHHLLSRVGFSVIATNPNENVSITIHSMRLCGMFPKKGKVSLKNTTASIQADETEYATYYDFFQEGESFTVKSSVCGSEVGDNSRIHTGDVEDRFMMLMPGQLDGAYIEVEYQLTGAEKRFAKVELGSMPLKAGFAYEFVLRVATASIEFSGVVEGYWGSTGTNGNTNIPQEN